jgi:hypothetical protein
MKEDSKKYNSLLLNKFPELKEKFDEYTEWQEGIETGSLLVYEDVFVPYILECLINDKKDELIKIADFIENLITMEDEYAFNIAYIAILESLKSNPNGIMIQKYLKDKSLKEFNELVY